MLCTHLHFDHVGWNTHRVDGRWVPTFPNARYLFSRREYDHWRMLRDTGGYHAINHLSDAVDPVVEAGLVDFIPADHAISEEIRLFPTPGHTPGHVSVHIASQGEEAVITGDMMHHPIQVALPEHPATFDWTNRPVRGRASSSSGASRTAGAGDRQPFRRPGRRPHRARRRPQLKS